MTESGAGVCSRRQTTWKAHEKALEIIPARRTLRVIAARAVEPVIAGQIWRFNTQTVIRNVSGARSRVPVLDEPSASYAKVIDL
jgi:hypothetical protein